MHQNRRNSMLWIGPSGEKMAWQLIGKEEYSFDDDDDVEKAVKLRIESRNISWQTPTTSSEKLINETRRP